MILSSPLVAPMTVARTLLDGHSAPIPQLTLARFIEGGHFGAHLVRTHLADFVEARVPAGGMQMPCVFIRDIAEREFVDSARRAGIDLLGLTALHASHEHRGGFLMGFAAHAPAELEIAVKKLADVLRALSR